MPAGKMKIQTNALIRDAETLLENVSRRWLLATQHSMGWETGGSSTGYAGGATRGYISCRRVEMVAPLLAVRASMKETPSAAFRNIF